MRLLECIGRNISRFGIEAETLCSCVQQQNSQPALYAFFIRETHLQTTGETDESNKQKTAANFSTLPP